MKKKSKKVFILLPDGVGLRNFAFTHFSEIAKENELDLVYWNNTEFPLHNELGFNEIKISNAKCHFASDLYKRAKTKIELLTFFKRTNDKAFLSYIFPDSKSNLKTIIKNKIVNAITRTHSSKKGQERVRKQISKFELKTDYYNNCVEQLKEHRPDFVFCTNQRPILAVAPLLAAKTLDIPTATFIFSWDNLPKGTLIVEVDYYFVWSDFMKQELLEYYPYIEEKQVVVTGTPQFEIHYDKENIVSKESFFNEYKLDLNKKYICFSGDDVTTSPFDQYYLEDLALTVEKLNEEGHNLGIIFRKCPVDFSGRFDKIIQQHKDIITSIDPKWKNLGNSWNKVMPFKEDIPLLINTIRNSELIVNIGSTMAFDGHAHNTPCVYINYDTEKGDMNAWKIERIYKFIHFKSMPSKEVVFWANSKDDLRTFILKSLDNNQLDLKHMDAWYDKIAMKPQQNASRRILKSIETIIEST
ncbi:MAG: UDP-glycosyltransferase [Flavobacteriaceae bacterium]